MSSGRDWSAEIEILLGQMTEHYVFPDVAEQVCQLLRQRLAGGAYRDLADEAARTLGPQRARVRESVLAQRAGQRGGLRRQQVRRLGKLQRERRVEQVGGGHAEVDVGGRAPR